MDSTSSHGGHQSGGDAILAVCISTMAVATILVGIRVYVRVAMTRSFWWDDATILMAMALSITGAAFNILSVKYGAGKHSLDLPNPQADMPKIVMWNTAYQIDNVISVNLVKVSILLFILRLQNNKKLAYAIWAVMAIMTIVNLVTVGALAAQCQPLKRLWNKSVPGKCFYEGELSKFGYAQGVINILSDFFCTAMPVLIMWNVRIALRVKIVICSLTSLGLMATASQIVRVVLLNTLNAEDYSHGIIGIVISAILDQNLGIIAACIPTFRPLFRSFDATFRSSRASGTPGYHAISGKLGSDHQSHRSLGADLAYPRHIALVSANKSFGRVSIESDTPLRQLAPAKAARGGESPNSF